jgi:hypothetical protein
VIVTMSMVGTSVSNIGGLVPTRVGRWVGLVGVGISESRTVGWELIAILGRAVGNGIEPIVGLVVGLTELGSSDSTTAGTELTAILGRGVGNFVG